MGGGIREVLTFVSRKIELFVEKMTPFLRGKREEIF